MNLFYFIIIMLRYCLLMFDYLLSISFLSSVIVILLAYFFRFTITLCMFKKKLFIVFHIIIVIFSSLKIKILV